MNLEFVKILFILFLLAGFYFTPILAGFDYTDYGYDGDGIVGPDDTDIPTGAGLTEFSQVVDIVIEIVKWTYTIFFIAAVFMILVAAYNYLTAQDEPEKIKSATNQIIFAAVAVAIALIAVSFNLIIKSFFTGGTTGTGGSASSPRY